MRRAFEIGLLVVVVLTILVNALPTWPPERQMSNDSAAVANLRTINTAEVTYLSSSSGIYGTMEDLIDAKLLDDTFAGTRAGYNYTITLDATGYTAEAVPAVLRKWHSWFSWAHPTMGGRYNYYSVPDAVVRYGTLAPTAAQVGKSVQ